MTASLLELRRVPETCARGAVGSRTRRGWPGTVSLSGWAVTVLSGWMAAGQFTAVVTKSGLILPYLAVTPLGGCCGWSSSATRCRTCCRCSRRWRAFDEGVLVLARNVIGITGIGLLCSLVTGGLPAWTLPMGYMAFCRYALLEAWTAPWAWLARPPADRGAWICACAVFVAGLLLLTIRGPRICLSDPS